MKTLFELFCWAILLGMMICISAAHSDELRIAVIDTGIDLKDTRINSHLCATGHVDFTEEGLQDDIGHGTAIVGLIEQYAKDSNYCIVMIKWYGEKGTANGKTFCC